MDFDRTNRELMDFLDSSPVPFFAILNMKKRLKNAGFTELAEGEKWLIEPGGSYYVSRNGSALIAFRVPEMEFTGFMMMASHCDSPVFKVKPNAEITVENRYVKLNVEKYGGMLCAPWLDRPLSVAGRVIVQTQDGIETRLVMVDRDLLIIPSLAIHMNREANDGFKYNAQTDLLPLFGELPDGGKDSPSAAAEQAEAAGTKRQGDPGRPVGITGTDHKKAGRFLRLIAEEAGVEPEQILDTDLYLYSRMKAARVGLDGEFIASGRLDDLQCAFASLQGFLSSEPVQSIAVHCVFDNEEVGSGTRQGAAGTFLRDVLYRINEGLGRSEEEYLRALSSSFMISADNAHSVHPNHPEKADPSNRPAMNRGIVIKYSANQKYTTDAVSGAVFRAVCRKAGVPCQVFTNRSDMIGGSTLGNISQSQVSVRTVDIGLAQLAMHSPYETAGARDTAWLAEAARVFFSGSLKSRGDGTYTLCF